MSEFNAALKEGLGELKNQLDTRLDEQAKNNGKASQEVRADMKAMAEDFASMQKEVVSLNDAVTGIEQQGVTLKGSAPALSMGSQVVSSASFKNYMAGQTNKFSGTFQNNTIVTGGDNSITRHDQLPGVVPGAFQRLDVIGTVAQGSTESNIIHYSRESGWTNNAAGQVEGSAKAESILAFEEVAVPVRTMAHFIKASKQALDDSTFLASYIDQRMGHGVRNLIEQQVINGDGTGQNLSGWLANGNNTIVDGAGLVDIFGATNKLKETIEVANYMPDYFYFNPANWSQLELIRRGTGDAAFVGGDGGALYYPQNGMPPMLWGIPVIVSNNIPLNTILCKSRGADMYFSREGVGVQMFEQDDTNVQSNLVTIRAEARGAEAVMVPAAIASLDVTSITA